LLALVLLPACSGDDGDRATDPSVTATPSVEATTPTTEAPGCDELAEQYFDAFFAVGAGTPEDPDATTVELPLPELLAIDIEARQLGCLDFIDVACSAYAELEDQGLEVTNSDPPDAC
jgi:hypothetical protein